MWLLLSKPSLLIYHSFATSLHLSLLRLLYWTITPCIELSLHTSSFSPHFTSLPSDTCSNSMRVLKTSRQTAGAGSITSLPDLAKSIISKVAMTLPIILLTQLLFLALCVTISLIKPFTLRLACSDMLSLFVVNLAGRMAGVVWARTADKTIGQRCARYTPVCDPLIYTPFMHCIHLWPPSQLSLVTTAGHNSASQSLPHLLTNTIYYPLTNTHPHT